MEDDPNRNMASQHNKDVFEQLYIIDRTKLRESMLNLIQKLVKILYFFCVSFREANAFNWNIFALWKCPTREQSLHDEI
jgi:hypothetical protein